MRVSVENLALLFLGEECSEPFFLHSLFKLLTSKAVRDEQFGTIMSQPEWRDIWAKHPNSNAYLQMNVRFMQRID